ncbi:MAG: chorismate synthase [candidate division Zixibacteria bacterium]|nr:chorismate synthase [candidate division Zixibacteria bacterium]
MTYLTSGESHGPRLTAIIDGLPSGLPLDDDRINYQLARRQKGYGRGGRMQIEDDRAVIISGVRRGLTLGGPVTIDIENKDWHNWSETMSVLPSTGQIPDAVTEPRPGHADLAGGIKYNHCDLRNVFERASARETAARVALGAIARQLLEIFTIEFASHVIRIGDAVVEPGYNLSDFKKLQAITENSPVRCLDARVSKLMTEAIDIAEKDGDTLGGIAEIIVRGLPVGLGGFSQASQRLDSRLAAAMVSIPSVKGVEFGLGFKAARRRGSEAHDEIFYDGRTNTPRKGFYRRTNYAGGIEGGITNGEDIIIRVASKPISTLKKPLSTVDIETKQPVRAAVERADICVVPALAVIAENVAALVLAGVFLDKFGGDSLTEIKTGYEAFLRSAY